MRPDGHDGDRDDPERHLAGPMDDRQPRDAEALRDLVGDGLEDPDGHGVVGLVLERVHGAAGVAGGLGLLARGGRAGRRPGPAEEPDDGAVLVRGEAIGQLGQDLGPERRPRAARRSAAARLGTASPAPPDTGGMTASSSPSARRVGGVGVVAVPGEPDRVAARREDRERGRRAPPSRRPRVAPSARSSSTNRSPASSRWMANSRTRTRTPVDVDHPCQVAMSRPSPTGSDRRRHPRIVEHRGIEDAQGVGIDVVRGRRTDARHATAPQDVVDDEERAGLETVGDRFDVRAVLVLQRVDEDEVERPGERRIALLERGEGRLVDDRDPLVGDARLAPPVAGEVGPGLGPGRSSRSCRRRAGRGPSTASNSRRPSRTRRSVVVRRPGLAAPGRCRDRRSARRAARPRPRWRRARG